MSIGKNLWRLLTTYEPAVASDSVARNEFFTNRIEGVVNIPGCLFTTCVYANTHMAINAAGSKDRAAAKISIRQYPERNKLQRAYGGCLGAKGRRRTWLAAISRGEPSAGVISADFRMGQPTQSLSEYSCIEFIDAREGTGGTETSQYPEEKKSFPK